MFSLVYVWSLIFWEITGALAGVGGGGILTLVMIVTSDVVSLDKRGTYQGILGVVVAASNSIGPLVGGVFSEDVSWRWCFVSPSTVPSVQQSEDIGIYTDSGLFIYSTSTSL